jgi:hypothetical protein
MFPADVPWFRSICLLHARSRGPVLGCGAEKIRFMIAVICLMTSLVFGCPGSNKPHVEASSFSATVECQASAVRSNGFRCVHLSPFGPRRYLNFFGIDAEML